MRRRGDGVRDRRGRRAARRSHEPSPSTPGATPTAACPTARPRRRCAAPTPSCGPATCSSWPRCAARPPANPTTPTRRTAGRSGSPGQRRQGPVGRAVRQAAAETNAVDVTEIAWDADDALPFPLCMFAHAAREADQRRRGATSCSPTTAAPSTRPSRSGPSSSAPVYPPPPGTATRKPNRAGAGAVPPAPQPRTADPVGGCQCARAGRTDPCGGAGLVDERQAGRAAATGCSLTGSQFSPARRRSAAPAVIGRSATAYRSADPLRLGGKLFARPPDPACAVTAATPRDAGPAIGVARRHRTTWQPQPDLLASDGDADRVFVVETEHDGTARSASATTCTAAEPARAFTADLPGRQRRRGQRRRGRDRARRHADGGDHRGRQPAARRRAVSSPRPPTTSAATPRRRSSCSSARSRAADYAEVAERSPRGAARRGDLPLDRLVAHRVRHRRPLRRRCRRRRLRDAICAATWSTTGWPATTSRSTAGLRAARGQPARVRRATLLRSGRSRRRRVTRRRTGGFFHPDHLTFAQPVYLSRHRRRRPLGARRHLGQRHDLPAPTRRHGQRPRPGVLTMGRLEIARLDNDPNFPERGLLDPDPRRRTVSRRLHVRLLRRRQPSTPQPVHNRPGLPAMAYRVGSTASSWPACTPGSPTQRAPRPGGA